VPDLTSLTRTAPPHYPTRPIFGPRLEALLVVAAAVALTMLFWPRLWLGGGLIGGDIYAYYLPQKAFYAECLREGTFPFWNNRVGNGYPQLAESQTGALYPPNLVLYRWLDLNTAYNASVLSHYGLAFAGCWLLARRISLAGLPAALAALIYTYSWFPPRISLEWTIVGGAWLPVAVWCVESFLQQRLPRWVMLLAVVLGLQLLAGHFLVAFLTQLLIVGYVPLRLVIAGGNLPGATRGARGATCRWLIAAVAGSYLLAAAQLLPTWELKRLSQRSVVNAEHDPGHGAVPPRYLQQVVAPWAWYADNAAFSALYNAPRGRPVNRIDAHLYFGMLPLVLIVVGVWGAWHDSNRVSFVWLALGILAILYMPGWFLPITRRLPGFSYFEGPGRYGIVATLAAALLAGAGFQVVRAWIRPVFRLFYVPAVFAATTADLIWVSNLVHDAEQIDIPPVNLISKSPLYVNVVRRPTDPVRLFSEGLNAPSLVGAGTLPVYLGLSPACYYDPQFMLPKPYPFRETLPTREQIEWLRRMGVTHIWSLTKLDENVWPVELVGTAPDPCLNPVLGLVPTTAPLAYELKATRGRAAWLDSDSGPPPRILKYAPHCVQIAAESEQGGTLVLTDLDYPGWQVEIDGQPAVSVVVEGMLRGVALPPGSHVATWNYRPASFYQGLAISTTALVVLLTLGQLCCRRPALFSQSAKSPSQPQPGGIQ
jgi:hypothetical protein